MERKHIVIMSLSKLGLPGTRTGIVIANEEVISMVSQVNAVVNLAPGSMGAAIATDLVRRRKIIDLSRNVIRPFYQKKCTFRNIHSMVADSFQVVIHLHNHKDGSELFYFRLELCD